jgi:hypothetical protein
LYTGAVIILFGRKKDRRRVNAPVVTTESEVPVAEVIIPNRGSDEEEKSCSCEGSGRAGYTSELPDGTLEGSRELCACWRAFVAESMERETEKILRARRVFEERGDAIIASYDGRVYWVPSASRPGLLHAVSIDGEESCSCEDRQINHNTCWHLTCATMAAAKSARCTLCGNRFRYRRLLFAEEGQANLGEGQPICRSCAEIAGVA